MIDVGCGAGGWLAAAQNLGVNEILGTDGDYVDTTQLLIPSDRFMPMNLEHEMPRGLRFDLAISLEVAEHLTAGRAASFVEGLCNLSDVVLFSAAIPKQGGQNHVNEQWQGYWIKLFETQGFRAHLFFRGRLWNETSVQPWYRQNITIFTRKGTDVDEKLQQEHRPTDFPTDVIHPMYWEREKWARVSFSKKIYYKVKALLRR